MALPIWQRTITTESGDVIPGAEVEVVNEATGLAADIFSTRAGTTPRTNPFFTGADGFAQFYVAPGEYRITATGPTGSIVWRHNVLTGDAALRTTGTGAAQVPTNSDLGTMSTQDANAVAITGGTASLSSLTGTAVAQGLFDNTVGRLLKVGDYGVTNDAVTALALTSFADNFPRGSVIFANTSNVSNLPPESGRYIVQTFGNATETGTIWQIALHAESNALYTRMVGNAWTKYLNSGNEQQIGVNQTWQDVSASRSAGVTFTNTTGRPIFVTTGQTSFTSRTLTVDGFEVSTNAGDRSTCQAIVPNGSTYSLNLGFTFWFELR